MSRKVTIQDIADALGLSRNTVSKAINNSEGLADATRDMILDKAVEMGYKQFSYVKALTEIRTGESSRENAMQTGEIALLTTPYLERGSHFASLMLDKFHREISQLGFTLVTHAVYADNIRNLSLPMTFWKETTQAIICIEIFDKPYADMICSLGLPVLFVDGPCNPLGRSVNADLLLMDNMTEITQFIHDKAAQGIRKIGFIGDYRHCQSFFERYSAYRMGILCAGLETDESFVISPPDRDLDAIRDRLLDLKEYPDLFICANDFIAIDVIMMMRKYDPSFTDKVRLLGFDDSHESRIVTPSVSTVHIHTQAMAFAAVQLLISRIQEPAMEFRTVHVATDLILRESTEF